MVGCGGGVEPVADLIILGIQTSTSVGDITYMLVECDLNSFLAC